MNKVLLVVGILSAGVAFGQTTRTTKSSSTTSSTSNYNNSNTNNYNSRNATSSSGSSYSGTSGSMSTGTTGTSNSNGTYNNSTSVTPSGSNNYNTMGTSGAATTTPTEPYSNSTAGATGTTGTYNSNGTYNNSTSVTPSGSNNFNTMGTSGTTSNTYSNTNPSGSYNSTTNTSTSGNYNTMGTSGATTTPSTTGTYDNNSTNTGTSTYNSTSTSSTRNRSDDPAGPNGYNNFVFGIYAGLNATNLRGESVNTENPSSRLGYQAGIFLRGGGRLYGQIGAEYFASSSNYFRAGNASSSGAIRDYINVQYVQIPVYIGYKLTESEGGNSAVRVQIGAEYANRISSDSRSFNLSKEEIKSGSFNALGQLGFDIGPFLIDLTYHYGLGTAVQINTFQGSSRRILSASVGFKF